MESVVVSVRISKDAKIKLLKEGVDIEKSIKEFILQKTMQIELREEVKRLKSIVEKHVKPSKRGFAVKSVREDRYVAH